EEKDVARRKRSNHLWKKCRQKRGEDPMREAAQCLALGTMAVGKDFGNKNPDNSTLADGMGGDEGENARGDDSVMLRKEGPRGQAERTNVAKGADVEQGAPPQPIDQPQTYK